MGNGSISEAHTGVMPEIKPPNGKPPEPSKRLPRVKLFMLYLHFGVFVGQPITLNGHTVRPTNLLDIPLHDYIAELFVQFHGVADAVGLLTGNKRRAGTAEGVKHHAVAHGRIHNGICQERDRFHGRMVAILLGLIKFPDGGFLPAGVPLMLAVFLPSVQTGFVLPLVRRASQHKGLLFQMQQPDK